MLKDTRIKFWVEERRNVHTKNGTEWALNVRVGDTNVWNIHAWSKNPSKQTVEEAKRLVLRSMEIYHKQLSIPPFELEVME